MRTAIVHRKPNQPTLKDTRSMERIPLSIQQDHLELESLSASLQQNRFFQKIHNKLLKEMMRQGEIVQFKAEDHLIRENVPRKSEIFVLLEGTLVVTSKDTFLMRLENPGDVVGEMSILSGETPHTTSVIAESDCRVIAFPNTLFEVEEDATKVSVAYLVFTHILSEKLRVTSAQVMLSGNMREVDDSRPLVAIVDENLGDRSSIQSLIAQIWEKAELSTFGSLSTFLAQRPQKSFDLLVLDPCVKGNDNQKAIRNVITSCEPHAEEIMVISSFSENTKNRRLLSKWGVSEFVAKPYSDFDLEHVLDRQRVLYYRQKELRRVEHAADTDRLTGLANRRRLDEFMEAMVILYPDEKVPFSLIMADVDNFKHYNDTHGHQMGDVVLATIANILKNRVRRGDLAARFGGEEFVVILPKCGMGNAYLIAEQLRKAFEDENIPYQEQQPLGNLTATFGVATFPDDAEDVETLLKKADDCLYRGKKSGRNVVISASHNL